MLCRFGVAFGVLPEGVSVVQRFSASAPGLGEGSGLSGGVE